MLNRSDRSDELLPLLENTGVEAEFINFERDLRDLALGVDAIISTVPAKVLETRYAELGHAPVLDVIYNPLANPTGYMCCVERPPHRRGFGHASLPVLFPVRAIHRC